MNRLGGLEVAMLGKFVRSARRVSLRTDFYVHTRSDPDVTGLPILNIFGGPGLDDYGGLVWVSLERIAAC